MSDYDKAIEKLKEEFPGAVVHGRDAPLTDAAIISARIADLPISNERLEDRPDIQRALGEIDSHARSRAVEMLRFEERVGEANPHRLSKEIKST